MATLPEYLAQVGQSIDRLREVDGPAHTPVLMAAGGPKARALARHGAADFAELLHHEARWRHSWRERSFRSPLSGSASEA